MRAIRLKTEHLFDPLGIDIKRPRLSWNCEGGIKQTAYEIVAPKWQSGRVKSGAMHADYPLPLSSRERVNWKVRLYDENGEPGEWSEAFFETGLFTRTLWQMCTECIVVFPEGVNVLPWMLCGTNEIGEATAKKMETARLVVWAQHGIYGAGRDLDETFGLIETAEKAAEIYMKIAHLPLVNTIADEQLHLLEKRFGVKAREGYLD